MKKIVLIFILITGSYFKTSAQTMDIAKKIQAAWCLSPQDSNKNELHFKQLDSDDNNWRGSYLTIYENGKIEVGHDARCGNDPEIFHKEGKWEYLAELNELISTISIHKMGERFKVKFTDDNKLVLLKH